MLEDKNEKMLRNLYNIQKMAFSLDKQNIGIDMIRSFEMTARKIDEIDTTAYNAATISKFEKAKTIEEEESRLKELISLIESRIDKRNKLLEDFSTGTGASLEPLDSIKAEDKLEEYKERYNNISRYLDAREKITTFEKELTTLQSDLKKAQEENEINLQNNKNYETDLKVKLNSIIASLPFLTNLNENNSQELMKKAKEEVKEAENALDAFNVAFDTIKHSGISIEQTSRYEQDRKEFRKSYYVAKKKIVILKIYDVLQVSAKLNYEEMLFKRDKIKSFINELSKIRYDFSLEEDPFLEPLSNLINKQYELIKSQYDNISIINKLEEKIKFKEEKLKEYKEVIKEEEIRKILVEYSIIKEENKKVEAEVLPPKEEVKIEKPRMKPNTIINVSPLHPDMDILTIKNKTVAVMSRVSKLLGIGNKPKIKTTNYSAVSPEVYKPKEEVKPPVIPEPEVPIREERPIEMPKNVNNIPIFEEKSDDIFVSSNTNAPKIEEPFFEMPSLPSNNNSRNYTTNPVNLNKEFELPDFPF